MQEEEDIEDPEEILELFQEVVSALASSKVTTLTLRFQFAEFTPYDPVTGYTKKRTSDLLAGMRQNFGRIANGANKHLSVSFFEL